MVSSSLFCALVPAALTLQSGPVAKAKGPCHKVVNHCLPDLAIPALEYLISWGSLGVKFNISQEIQQGESPRQVGRPWQWGIWSVIRLWMWGTLSDSSSRESGMFPDHGEKSSLWIYLAIERGRLDSLIIIWACMAKACWSIWRLLPGMEELSGTGSPAGGSVVSRPEGWSHGVYPWVSPSSQKTPGSSPQLMMAAGEEI